MWSLYVLTDGDTDITEDDLHRGQDPDISLSDFRDHQSGRQELRVMGEADQRRSYLERPAIYHPIARPGCHIF